MAGKAVAHGWFPSHLLEQCPDDSDDSEARRESWVPVSAGISFDRVCVWFTGSGVFWNQRIGKLFLQFQNYRGETMDIAYFRTKGWKRHSLFKICTNASERQVWFLNLRKLEPNDGIEHIEPGSQLVHSSDSCFT